MKIQGTRNSPRVLGKKKKKKGKEKTRKEKKKRTKVENSGFPVANLLQNYHNQDNMVLA